jgi:hypothetical protein
MTLFPWPALSFLFGVVWLWIGAFANFARLEEPNEELFMTTRALRVVSVLAGTLAVGLAFWLRFQGG